MLLRLLNLSLLIAAVIGGVLAYRVAVKHRGLSAEHRRLEAKVGSLPIEDPTRIHIRALDTDEECSFAWRVYVPAGLGIMWQHGGGSATSWDIAARHFIAQLRIRQSENGCLEVFTSQAGGSGKFQLGNQALADLLRDRWSDISVEQLGTEGVVVLEPDTVATLLRLTLPDDLKQQAKRRVGEAVMRQFQAGLLDIRFGSDQAFQRAAEREEAADEL